MHTLAPVLMIAMALSEGASRPAPGDAAPAFTAAATTGGNFGLADFKGKTAFVLAFFPKAFTSG